MAQALRPIKHGCPRTFARPAGGRAATFCDPLGLFQSPAEELAMRAWPVSLGVGDLQAWGRPAVTDSGIQFNSIESNRIEWVAFFQATNAVHCPVLHM